MQAHKENKSTNSKCADEAFTTREFANWKDAKVCFMQHENSNCHKEAIQFIVTIPKHYKDCAEMLSTHKILCNVQVLA